MSKRARRMISHHGSDCPDGPHPFKSNRCLILTRIDYPDQPGRKSVAWVSGDCAETMPRHATIDRSSEYHSERMYRKRHTFDPKLPTWYGGGFWDRVEIGPKE